MFQFNPAALPGDVASAALFLPATPLGGAWGAFNPGAPPGDVATAALYLAPAMPIVTPPLGGVWGQFNPSAMPGDVATCALYLGASTITPTPGTGVPAGWFVLAVAIDDFGKATTGAQIKATIQGSAPFSLDGQALEVDAVTYSSTGADLGLDATAYPDSAGLRYLLLPPQSLVRDRRGQRQTQMRFDSIGMPGAYGEMIRARIVALTAEAVARAGGSLWKLLAAST